MPIHQMFLGTSNLIEYGQEIYNTPGTYSWTAPPLVTSVSVVCVGGGGGGSTTSGSGGAGGGGGGLGWKNNISVIPGQSYTVVVGSAGERSGSTGSGATAGSNSYFINTSTVAGLGGGPGVGRLTGGAGGGYVGDGGGNGGNGGTSGTTSAGGGGGAGGYSGNGGDGGSNTGSGTNGSGGGGGGGGGAGSSDAAGAGGGVGIFGEGLSGTGATGSIGNGRPGTGGSGGNSGSASPGSTARPSTGGLYGGGGGGAELNGEHGPGASGVVRIVWGTGRAFPSTNVFKEEGYVSSTTMVSGNSSMSVPSGLQAGDLLIYVFVADVANTSEFVPTGFTKGQGIGSSGGRMLWAYKIATGNETTIDNLDTIRPGENIHAAFIFRNVSMLNTGSIQITNAITITPPTISASVGNIVVILAAQDSDDNRATGPSDYTEIVDAGGIETGLYVGYKIITATGTETPGAVTFNNDNDGDLDFSATFLLG